MPFMTRAARPRSSKRGSIDTLPGGALRVRVYGGTDPLTKRHGSVKRVASAVGDGSMCIRLVHEYLALTAVIGSQP